MSELASLKERIDVNLSGQQIATLLDELLMAALEPIAVHTNLSHRMLAELVVLVQNDGRRKFSSLYTNADLLGLIFVALSESGTNHFRLLADLKIERNFWSGVLDHFLAQTESYHSQYAQHLTFGSETIAEIERDLQCSGLIPIINHVRATYALYRDFKEVIMQKYVRYAFKEANKSSKATGLNINVDDLFKNLLLAVDRAIDKYDPEKGALKSYIDQWFKNAKTNPEFDHQSGESYRISAEERRRIVRDHEDGSSGRSNFAVELDSSDTVQYLDTLACEHSEEPDESSADLVLLINSVPRTRFAHLFYHLPFQLTDSEIQALQSTNSNS